MRNLSIKMGLAYLKNHPVYIILLCVCIRKTNIKTTPIKSIKLILIRDCLIIKQYNYYTII